MVIDSTDIPDHEKPSGDSTTGAYFGHRTAPTGESDMFYGYKLRLAAVNTSAGPVLVAARVAASGHLQGVGNHQARTTVAIKTLFWNTPMSSFQVRLPRCGLKNSLELSLMDILLNHIID